MFGAVRFASCLVLTCIAALQWSLHPELQPFMSLLTFVRSFSLLLGLDPRFCQIYASILSGLSIAFASWSQVFIGHVNLLLGLQTALYFYRDIYPLATFTKHPMDTEEGGLLWVKIMLLFVVAVILPLIAPRAYIPVDPLVDLSPLPQCHTHDFQNPIPPNAEQTASILSSYLFSFLDGLVYSANKKSKRDQEFSYEDLPTLADYSHASNLKKKSFPVSQFDSTGHSMTRLVQYVDEFHGAPKRHIFFGLLKTFRFRLVVAFVVRCLAWQTTYSH